MSLIAKIRVRATVEVIVAHAPVVTVNVEALVPPSRIIARVTRLAARGQVEEVVGANVDTRVLPMRAKIMTRPIMRTLPITS